MTPRRSLASFGVWVRTTILASTGVVQEAGVPRRPWISTRHRRHEPKGSSESVAQSFGTWVPMRLAAAMTDVPAGTVTATPSIVSVTSSRSDTRIGVPVSSSLIRPMVASANKPAPQRPSLLPLREKVPRRGG